MKKRIILLAASILLIVATALITRAYVIRTAQPDRECYIVFGSSIHHYE